MNLLTHGRSRLLFIACAAIAVYFAYLAFQGQLKDGGLGDDRAAAAAKLQELQEKKAYLEGVKKYVASDAYVEQEARRRLGYVRDGEISFVVVSPPVPEKEQPAADWWERLFPR